jgi:hypothetical protein
MEALERKMQESNCVNAAASAFPPLAIGVFAKRKSPVPRRKPATPTLLKHRKHSAIALCGKNHPRGLRRDGSQLIQDAAVPAPGSQS